MGGAERNARKRKQQRSPVGKAAAASSGMSRITIAAVAGVVVLAIVVIGGVVWTKSGQNQTAGNAIPVADGEGKTSQQASRDGVVVVRGAEDAKATIDIYEDFLCPICGQFEDTYGDKIDEKVEKGELRVRYHMVPLLNKNSNPPGYSLDAANATLCAADKGKFETYHDSLFAAQPKEGTRGYGNEQLIELGGNVGIDGDEFSSCVKNDKYDDKLNSEFDKILQNPDLKRSSNGRESFGTPTVTADGEILNALKNPNWLSELLSEGSE